ncbi:MAG TPA: sterol desaturase family protein [Puia sp.]|nr:sterol desaturase family protein [Puia sp.]
MDIWHTLYDEAVGFLGIGSVINLVKTGNYSTLLTLDGILGAIGPLVPLLLIIEIIRALYYRRFQIAAYKIPFLIYIFNRVGSRFVSIAAIAYCIGLFGKHAIFKSSFAWYWLIYGYIVWELGHFFYHYLAHKIRLFWCLHSTHHAPENMNLSVTYAHFILEAPYADVIRTTTCILLGVSPPLLFFIMFIDGTWGAFIHVGENILKDGRLGLMNRFILTPSHHRVHHARNPAYMDTNFCNLLNIWDRLFRTFSYERQDIPVEFGITRQINSNNFFDVYFGEIFLLVKDIVKAPGIKNKFLYAIMPPGWNHTGNHKTAKSIRKSFLDQEATNQRQNQLTDKIPAELLD